MKPRNRELLGLVPAALLVTAGFAAVFIQQNDLRQEISENPQGATYFARVELGRRVEAALEAAGERYVRDIHAALKPAAVASRANKPIGERMILNAAFLVDRAREAEFDEAVKGISRKYEGQLTFKYTGPWPPYNFVNIKLKLEKAGN